MATPNNSTNVNNFMIFYGQNYIYNPHTFTHTKRNCRTEFNTSNKTQPLDNGLCGSFHDNFFNKNYDASKCTIIDEVGRIWKWSWSSQGALNLHVVTVETPPKKIAWL